MWQEVVILLAVLLVWLWIRRPQRPKNFPPGPPTFLFFGNLPCLVEASGADFLKVMKSLRSKYKSDVIGLIGPNGGPMVHVFGNDLIKEVSSRTEFSGRPELWSVLYQSEMQRAGIFFNEGAIWQEQRRFSLKHLRDLGLGKNILNEVITDEYDHFSEEVLQPSVGKPLKSNKVFTPAVINIIWKMVADMRYAVDDPELVLLDEVMKDFSQFAGPQNLISLVPWSRFVIPEKSGFNGLDRYKRETQRLFQRVLKEHRANLDVDNPRDFVDAFLIEMMKPDAKERGFDELNLIAIGLDYFVAGLETTTTSMTWAMLLMVMHPKIQKKVQQEMDTVLSDGRRPTYGDRNEMPYTLAVLEEVFRFSCLTPLTVPHNTSFGPAELAGYTVPKDSLMLLHLHSIHRDPEYWGDPDVFRPERFIDENGKFRKDDHMMPFGGGKRACLGESLARMEFFLFFVCLLREFDMKLPDGAPTPSTDSPFGIFLQPGDYSVVLKARDGTGKVAA